MRSSRFRLLLPVLVIYIMIRADSSLATSSISSPAPKRPPFVAHLTEQDLVKARELAAKRHAACVDHALTGFNVDAIPNTSEEDEIAAAVQLKEYPVAIPTKLLDFNEELPKSVFLTDPPLLTKEECAHVIAMAEAHFAATPSGNWTRVPSGQYGFSGFYLKEVPTVHAWFVKIVKQRFFSVLQRTFPDFCESAADLIVDRSYLFKYAPETGRRTDVHTDEGCLSFTIALNSREEFEGGGTWFEGLSIEDSDKSKLGAVLDMDVGQVSIRASSLKHCGNAVTSGTRYIVGGFVMNRKKPENVRMLLTGNPANELEFALEASMALNPENDAPYTMLAHLAYDKGQRAKSQEILEYCLKHVNPGCADAAFDLARQYMEQGLHDKAMECLEICLVADPVDVDAMISMAQAAGEVGDTATEEEYLQRAVRTDGANEQNDAVKAQAYRNLGLLRKGQDSELDFYRKSIALEDNFEARYSMGRALFDAGRLSEALESFGAAVATQKTSSDKNKENSALKAMHRTSRALIAQEDKENKATPQRTLEQRLKDFMGEENFVKVQILAMQFQK